MFINPTYRQCHLGRQETILYREIDILKQLKWYETESLCSRQLSECSRCGELYVCEEHRHLTEFYECEPVNKIFIPVPSLEVADLIGNFAPMPYIQIYYNNGYEHIIRFPAYLEFSECIQYGGKNNPCHWHKVLPKMYNLKWWQEWCAENIVLESE